MPVAETASAAAQQLHLLAVFGDFAEVFAAFGVEHDCAAGNFHHDIVAVFAEAAASGAAFPVAGEYVSPVFQRQQRPHVAVALEDDMAATATVAAVGSAFGNIFGAVEVA